MNVYIRVRSYFGRTWTCASGYSNFWMYASEWQKTDEVTSGKTLPMMSDTSNPPQATPEATPGADAVDKLGALNMSARLRDMLSDHSTPKALPHA